MFLRKTIAVIGLNADKAETGGGGSSHVKPAMEAVSPLEGLKSALGSDNTIFFAKGVLTESRGNIIRSANLVPPGKKGKSGLLAEYFLNPDMEGTPYKTHVDSTVILNGAIILFACLFLLTNIFRFAGADF